MQLKYAKTLYLQASAATRASLAEKNLTPEKCIELERIKKVERWMELRNVENMTVVDAAAAVDEPSSNLYRWQKDPKVYSTRPKTFRQSKRTPELIKAVREVREENMTWGPEKVGTRVIEDGFETSVSTVGRILSDLIRDGLIVAYDHLISGRRTRKKRKNPRPHAIRLPKGLKPKTPGEIIEIDTVHTELPDGTKVYHMNGICPVSRYCWGDVYNSPSAKNASDFLRGMLDKTPFKIQSIQTDQGSEFRAEFETACKDLGLPLYVLPRKSPELNAHVERVNRTWQEDFYYCWELENHTLEMVKRLVEVYADHYNSERYHKSLGLLTPRAYLKKHWNIEY